MQTRAFTIKIFKIYHLWHHTNSKFEISIPRELQLEYPSTCLLN